jgi:hypothetical protein
MLVSLVALALVLALAPDEGAKGVAAGAGIALLAGLVGTILFGWDLARYRRLRNEQLDDQWERRRRRRRRRDPEEE